MMERGTWLTISLIHCETSPPSSFLSMELHHLYWNPKLLFHIPFFFTLHCKLKPCPFIPFSFFPNPIPPFASPFPLHSHGFLWRTQQTHFPFRLLLILLSAPSLQFPCFSLPLPFHWWPTSQQSPWIRPFSVPSDLLQLWPQTFQGCSNPCSFPSFCSFLIWVWDFRLFQSKYPLPWSLFLSLWF